MIDVVNVTQHYGVRPVLRQIELHIPSARLVAIVGPNGMGKTTLLSVIAGVLQPQRGYVEIDGKRRRRSVEEELEIRRRVVYLPDHPWLPTNRTGREFLLAVGRLYDLDPDHLIDHIDRILELFDLRIEGDWPIRSYSNGQKKKIAIGSVLVAEAPVLLLDEPFGGGLDPSGILALKQVLRGLVERLGATVVMSAPVPELVEEVGQEIVVLRDGQIAAYDSLDGLRRQTQCAGSLADVLGRLIHPQTDEAVQRYFEARKS
jgi:ABC-type multidrug transport system ATPase subunit